MHRKEWPKITTKQLKLKSIPAQHGQYYKQLLFCSLQYLQSWLQCGLVLPLSRILLLKSNKRETWAEQKYLTGLV